MQSFDFVHMDLPSCMDMDIDTCSHGASRLTFYFSIFLEVDGYVYCIYRILFYLGIYLSVVLVCILLLE